MADPGFLPLAAPPASDVVIGTEPYQVLWGRTGNDLLLGYYRSGISLDQIDIFLADSEFSQLVDPSPRVWSDTILLGDWRSPFYANGNPLLYGLNNFSLLADFDPANDLILLHGDPSQYGILDLGLISVIYYNQPFFPDLPGLSFLTFPDVVAITPIGSFAPTGSLSLSGSYFKFVGTSPPPVEDPSFEQVGTSGADISDAIAVDAEGNIFVIGTTTESLSAASQGFRDIWFRKYDKDGNLLFSRQFGSAGDDYAYAITTDSEGNVYVVGKSNGDFSGPTLGINSDAWIGKFYNDGEEAWIQKITGTPSGQPASSFGIDLSLDGFLYVSGVVDVPTPPDAEFGLTTDNFVAKYTIDGQQVWIKQQGDPATTAFDESYGSTVDDDGSIYSVGFTTGDFAGGLVGLYDAWISKYNKDGFFQWLKPIATPDYDWAWDVAMQSDGNPLVTGWTLGSFNPQAQPNLGSYDAYLASVDSATGNLLWVNQFGTEGDDEAFSLRIDNDGNVYVAGFTSGSFEGFINKGSYDSWVAKFNPVGSLLWVSQFGTSQRDEAYDLSIDNKGNVYVVGITNGSLGGLNQGTFDTWIARLDSVNGDLLDFSSGVLDSTSDQANALTASTATNPSPPDISIVSDFQAAYSTESFSQSVLDAIESLIGVDPSMLSPESFKNFLGKMLQAYPPAQADSFRLVVTDDGRGVKVVGTDPSRSYTIASSSSDAAPVGLWVNLTVELADAAWQNGVSLVRSTPGVPGSVPEAVGALGSTPNSGFLGGERYVFLGLGQELRFVQSSGQLPPVGNPTLAVSGTDPAITMILDDSGAGPDFDYNDLRVTIQSVSGFVPNEDVRMATPQVDATTGLLDLSDLSPAGEQLRIAVQSNSLLTNTLRFVKVTKDPVTGLQVAGVDADAPGFLNAVRANLLDFSYSLGGEGATGTATFTLASGAGGLYAPVLVSGNDDIFTFGSSTAADGLPHLKVFGQNSFGFEDLLASQGSDFDFNDFIVSIDRVSPATA